MTELLYAGAAPIPRPYSPEPTPHASRVNGSVQQRLSHLNTTRSSRPERWLAVIATLLLHAAVLALLNSTSTPPVTVPARPQPVSVELVSMVAEPVQQAQPAEPLEPEVVTPPPELAPPPVDKPVDDNALLPPEPEKKVPEKKPEPVPKKTPVKKSTTAPKPTPQPQKETASASAPITPAPVAQKAVALPVDAPLTPPLANADYLHNPAPSYPDVAISRGYEGTVLLNVQVRADGKVQTIRIHQSSGYPSLDEAARDTVLRWSFVPARRGSQPVSGWVVVPVDFSLNS
ncbi:TonB protein [Pectobacterium atrosepticum SCRI1043]|uniref:Protein TonB n=1 Tax=Pectobacterium atrosepticum (strain SCRI 1043 / ATCC BAA-672) TaxID=218491 RepID=Q6CZ53_PECAS|nr:energy transducer TonB [Pectobacterium atrosepticum]GKV87616.1 protein tonB2 [Pectobacterium carotovorum subsp. carotovorum]AIA73062.1 energy transducer TonB [Pectobacterium atrosepticum]AIK16045.1 TonB protein [Pectobacterium atrosepticum]ATY92725.1 energy transducer TonB [Pectobacterium atrosepticum]KFX13296.1 energy transducer TonB [Pectobacterium atrosepticum]